jgi:hypothetical protein
MATPNLLAMGKEALTSGAVSPEEVQAVQQSPEAKDWLAQYLKGHDAFDFSKSSAPQGQGPMRDPSAMPVPQIQAPAKLGKNQQMKQTGSGEMKTSTTKNIMAAPDEFSGYADIIRNLPEVQAQQEGIQQSQQMMDMTRGTKDDHNYIISPLLSLADAMNGTHMSANYQAPGGKSEKLLKYADDLQKRKADLSKTILEGVTKLKTGSEMAGQKQNVTNVFTDGTLANAGSGLANVRGQQLIARAGEAFDKDPILKQVQGTNNSLDRALSIMNGTTPVTAKNFALLQQDMINAMAQGGAATEGKVNREMVETLATKLNELQQFGGSIKDLRKDNPELFAQLKDTIEKVQSDYGRAGMDRAADIHSSYQNVEVPGVRETIDRKLADWNKKGAKNTKSESMSLEDKKKRIAELQAKAKNG